MKLVDTSAWIEITLGGDLAEKLGATIPAPERCLVPTIVQLELAKWLQREIGGGAVDAMIAHTSECVVIDLTTTRAVQAAELSRIHKLAMADAVIYACAVEHQAELITCDAHFRDLPGVAYFGKA